jgi:hypothetical protein
MLGHIGVNVRDLVRAKAYYDQLVRRESGM